MVYSFFINTDNYSKQSIINVAKSIFFKIEPANVDLYQYGHFTNKQIYEQVQRLPNLHTICSNSQFAYWLAKENAHFGKIITKRERESSLPVKGRPLWLFNEGIKGKKKHINIRLHFCLYF